MCLTQCLICHQVICVIMGNCSCSLRLITRWWLFDADGEVYFHISMKTRLSSISREGQNHNRNFYFNDWHFPHNSILHSLKNFLIFNLNQRFLSSSHLRSIWKISLYIPLPQSMMSTTLRVMQIRKLFHSFVLSSARSRRAISRELDNTDFKWWAKWRD